jgi:hypothetical protein
MIKSRVMLIVMAAILALMVVVGSAMAHNAGHIHLPTGECVDVGSGKHAHNPEQQDHIPGPGDQYGTRYAAELGNTPIWARHCDEVGAHAHP